MLRYLLVQCKFFFVDEIPPVLMFLNFNTKKRTVDLHTAMWEISGIVYPHFMPEMKTLHPR